MEGLDSVSLRGQTFRGLLIRGTDSVAWLSGFDGTESPAPTPEPTLPPVEDFSVTLCHDPGNTILTNSYIHWDSCWACEYSTFSQGQTLTLGSRAEARPHLLHGDHLFECWTYSVEESFNFSGPCGD